MLKSFGHPSAAVRVRFRIRFENGNVSIFNEFFQERNISPTRKFLGRISRGHPGVIRADIPAQNFGQGTQNHGKTNKHLGADIHDPKARTSTILIRDFQKLRSEKLWAEFSFPIVLVSGVVPANQTEESEIRELSGKESGTGSGTPFCLFFFPEPLKNGVPERIPDFFLESSRTSLSSVWFAGATLDCEPPNRKSKRTYKLKETARGSVVEDPTLKIFMWGPVLANKGERAPT